MKEEYREILDLLKEHHMLGIKRKDVYTKLFTTSMQTLGLTREELYKLNLPDFLDGYLAGKGHIQTYRIQAERKNGSKVFLDEERSDD